MLATGLQITPCDYIGDYMFDSILSSIGNAVTQILAKRIFLIFLFCPIIINGTIGNVRNNNNYFNAIHSSSSPRSNYYTNDNLYLTDGVVSNTEATLNDAVNKSRNILPPPTVADNDDNNQMTDNNNDDDDDDDTVEIQKAVCTVTAGEVKASAEAVTTKVLKGVCGSIEMHLALKDLELKFLKELEEIKVLLKQKLEITKANEIPATNTQPTGNPLPETKPMLNPPLLKDKADHDSDDINGTRISQSRKCSQIPVDSARGTTRGPRLKSLSRWRANSREYEVFKFNNTLLSDQDLKVFTYYWKLENISEHLINGSSSTTLESPIFSIKGKPLRIKAFFHHLQRDFLYLQLAYALQNGSKGRNNIILDTGGLFKKIASGHVQFNYKILILDQSNHHTQDLVSQEFVNLETGFLVPNSALLDSSFIKNNSLLVQVFLYL